MAQPLSWPSFLDSVSLGLDISKLDIIEGALASNGITIHSKIRKPKSKEVGSLHLRVIGLGLESAYSYGGSLPRESSSPRVATLPWIVVGQRERG